MSLSSCPSPGAAITPLFASRSIKSLDLTLDTDEENSNWMSSFSPVQHRRCIYIDARQQLDTEQIMQLRDFFSEACDLKMEAQDLTMKRAIEFSNPPMKRAIEGNQFIQGIQQGAKMEIAETAGAGQAWLQKISIDSDRFA